jgi:hypothetical protein
VVVSRRDCEDQCCGWIVRRGWEIRTGFFKGVAAAWGVIGFVAVFAVGEIFRTHDRHGHDTGAAWGHSPLHWVLPIYLAPVVAVAAVALAYLSAVGMRELWRHPPVRRITKPVLDDLRDIHSTHSAVAAAESLPPPPPRRPAGLPPRPPHSFS